MSRPEGWAIQRVYYRDGSRDVLMPVRHGDLVIVDQGYHPFASTQGYDAYYLNVLAGDRRTMANTDDPDLAWVRSLWPAMAPDPGCRWSTVTPERAASIPPPTTPTGDPVARTVGRRRRLRRLGGERRDRRRDRDRPPGQPPGHARETGRDGSDHRPSSGRSSSASRERWHPPPRQSCSTRSSGDSPSKSGRSRPGRPDHAARGTGLRDGRRRADDDAARRLFAGDALATEPTPASCCSRTGSTIPSRRPTRTRWSAARGRVPCGRPAAGHRAGGLPATGRVEPGVCGRLRTAGDRRGGQAAAPRRGPAQAAVPGARHHGYDGRSGADACGPSATPARTRPWVLLGAGADVATFVEQIRLAGSAGASGFLAGRGIWGGAIAADLIEAERIAREVSLPALRRCREAAERVARPLHLAADG